MDIDVYMNTGDRRHEYSGTACGGRRLSDVKASVDAGMERLKEIGDRLKKTADSIAPETAPAE